MQYLECFLAFTYKIFICAWRSDDEFVILDNEKFHKYFSKDFPIFALAVPIPAMLKKSKENKLLRRKAGNCYHFWNAFYPRQTSFFFFRCILHFLYELIFFTNFSYAMDLKPGTYLIAPSIKNVSCTHARYTQPLYYYIGPFDVIQALIILMLTIGIIGANLILIFVINHRRYSPYIHPQVTFYAIM